MNNTYKTSNEKGIYFSNGVDGVQRYSTSDGDAYTPEAVFITEYKERVKPKWRVRLLVSSICDSLERGSLDWNDEKAWEALEAGYNFIKTGRDPVGRIFDLVAVDK